MASCSLHLEKRVCWDVFFLDCVLAVSCSRLTRVSHLLVSSILYVRETIPFVFEIPTTLDALHELIATHASTGADASIIIQRIHSTNSVRLDRRNKEKMQNFYDVLLKRFVAVVSPFLFS